MDLIELASEQGPVESIEELVSRREMSEAVAEAMKRLPEEQRTAIVLKEYHGLTFQEIADLQGCPLSTVKTRLYQGLSVLRRHLDASGMTASDRHRQARRHHERTYSAATTRKRSSRICMARSTPTCRREVERHLRVVRAPAPQEVEGLQAVRQDLQTWLPPDAELGFTSDRADACSRPPC